MKKNSISELLSFRRSKGLQSTILFLNSLFKSYDVAKVVIFDVLPSFFGPKAPDDGIWPRISCTVRVTLGAQASIIIDVEASQEKRVEHFILLSLTDIPTRRRLHQSAERQRCEHFCMTDAPNTWLMQLL